MSTPITGEGRLPRSSNLLGTSLSSVAMEGMTISNSSSSNKLSSSPSSPRNPLSRPDLKSRRSTGTSNNSGILDNYYFSNDAGIGTSSSSSSLGISPSPSSHFGTSGNLVTAGNSGMSRQNTNHQQGSGSMGDLSAHGGNGRLGRDDMERLDMGSAEIKRLMDSPTSAYSTSAGGPEISTFMALLNQNQNQSNSGNVINHRRSESSLNSNSSSKKDFHDEHDDSRYDYGRQHSKFDQSQGGQAGQGGFYQAGSSGIGLSKGFRLSKDGVSPASASGSDYSNSSGFFKNERSRSTPIQVWETSQDRQQFGTGTPGRTSHTIDDYRSTPIGSRSIEQTPRASTSFDTDNSHNRRNTDGAPSFVYETSQYETPIQGSAERMRSTYTPTSGRNSAASVSASSAEKRQLENEQAKEPQSAPAWKTDFGFSGDGGGGGSDFGADFGKGLGMGLTIDGEGEETIKGRDKRSTLPTTPVGMDNGLRGDYLGVEKNSRGSSPQPPPRSALRTQLAGITSPLPNLTLDSYPTTSRPTTPLNISPRTYHTDTMPSLQVPDNSDAVSSTNGSPNSTGPLSSRRGSTENTKAIRQRGESTESSASINELTEMLAGAIDEIGLIKSDETPPPMVSADKGAKPDLKLKNLAPATGSSGTDIKSGPITPTSLPSRGESLSSASGMPLAASVPEPQPARNAPIINLPPKSENLPPVNPGIFIAKPWPASMLYGHIKNLKHPGDRANGYAKAIYELGAADSGLKEWCIASASTAHRPTRVVLNKLTPMNPNIELSPMYISQPLQSVPHARTVSSSSEFPTREDSYTAREISQRIIDPSDQPTSLPPNLPYPQLQPTRSSLSSQIPAVTGGMKASPSTNSMSSVASGIPHKKGGFLSALRGKKESTSLPPPTGPVNPGSNAIRPSESINKSSSSSTPIQGPRGPRTHGSISSQNDGRGSLEISGPVPYRGSFDSSAISKVSSASASRTSLDSSRTPQYNSQYNNNVNNGNGNGGKGIYEPNQSSTLRQDSKKNQMKFNGKVKEEDVNAMQDVLPQADKNTIRAYLSKHKGDSMNAISAYLEDEQKGRNKREV